MRGGKSTKRERQILCGRKEECEMTLLGMNQSRNAEGQYTTTLQVAEDFPEYYNNLDAGRRCVGKKVDSIYVGTYDCSNLKVGMSIEVLYEKAVQTKTGVFQIIKRIDVINK